MTDTSTKPENPDTSPERVNEAAKIEQKGKAALAKIAAYESGHGALSFDNLYPLVLDIAAQLAALSEPSDETLDRMARAHEIIARHNPNPASHKDPQGCEWESDDELFAIWRDGQRTAMRAALAAMHGEGK